MRLPPPFGALALAAAPLAISAVPPLPELVRPETASGPEWLAWGPAAFEQARRDGKPLLVLVVTYGCHPCRALERGVLSDPEVARTIGPRYLAVRVDADELPYTADALALAAREHGSPPALPLLVAQAPDGRLLDVAATVVAGDPAGLQSLKRWLERAAAGRSGQSAARDEQSGAGASVKASTPSAGPAADTIRSGPGAATFADSAPRGPDTTPHPQGAASGPAPARDAIEALAALASPLGDAPDDPLAPPPLPALRARLEALAVAGAPEQVRAADRLLERAARSAYRDHVGGGFHRGRTALEPPVMRYEKRLAENALWLRAFARGYAATGNRLYRDVAEEIVAWAVREMRDSSGAFWTAVDAASGGEDGAFYRFSREEVMAALGAARGAELLDVYRVVPPGLLSLEGSPFAGLGPSLEALRSRRGRRVRPAHDERILAGANGLLIGALAVSGRQLGRGSDLEAARRAAGAVLARLGWPRTPRHSAGAHAAGGPATQADYAYLAEGLLDLHAATGEARWRQEAVAVVDAAVTSLWDATAGGFRSGEGRGLPPLPAPRTARDTELPSANGVLAGALARLGTLTREPRYLRLARETLEAFAAEAERDPRGASTLSEAAAVYKREAAASSSR